MKTVIIENQSISLRSALSAGYCDSFLCRLKGLMFRKGIPEDWGLLLVQPTESVVNSAIHMFAVPFNLGVIWINQDGIVVDTAEVKKWVGIKSPKQPARYILEVTPSRLNEFNLGDKILFVDYGP
ncbi:MAG: hypothetical protein GWN62_04105 [Aliifodinibius sp.]|nr:hypothetical protein [Fodinibius sp.]